MREKLNILICDDNIAVHESLSAYLKAEDMNSVSVYDGQAAIEKLKMEHYDLIILDIMMPKIFGTEVCREIRKKSEIPIIMLSARGEEFDRIMGLEIGADDYITKPFSPREVIIRIKKILKRVLPKQEKHNVYCVGELNIDVEGYTAFVSSTKIDLTPKEIETIAYLFENKNKVMSRDQILDKVWGYDYYGNTRAVDTLIKRLRSKLPTSDLGFEIKTVYGVGYKLEVSL